MKLFCLAALLLTVPALAQGDSIFTVDGKTVENVIVKSWNIRQITFKEGGTEQTMPSHKVVRVELESFNDVFRLGLRDSDLMLTKAREQLKEKEDLLAQIGFVRASAMFFDENRPQEAVTALTELEKGISDAGTLPEVYRQKFEYYMGMGKKGARNGESVAKKYLSAAQGNAWSQGFVIEAEFFQALAGSVAGGDPKAYQVKLADIIQRAGAVNAMVANRANIQLGNSYLATDDKDRAKKIFERLADKDGVDESSRAGAYLGMGLLTMGAAGENKDEHKRALLWFLRVYLETRNAWPSLQAEALYNAVQAAGKWRGPDYGYIQARCRGVMKAEFPGSNWTERALAGR
ncbi:MAG: hypothetical protein NXI31_13695 [bacterium]|nr:hypothetical protein [bacterium]